MEKDLNVCGARLTNFVHFFPFFIAKELELFFYLGKCSRGPTPEVKTNNWIFNL